MKLMTNFIEYCQEDNEQLAKDIKIWLADYFDFKNRVIKVEKYEIDWIKENLTKQDQAEIFGKIIANK